ncbi:MAG: 30S ribosomal protein S8 [Endomicrobiia bacterium]
MSSDPIADMLTAIRNAIQVYHEKVDVPYSKIKNEIARIMKEEGFIENYKKIESPNKSFLRIYFKYGPKKEQVIREINRISKPGARIYCKYKDLDKDPFKIYILSTPKGIITNKEAIKLKVGGEVICSIY